MSIRVNCVAEADSASKSTSARGGSAKTGEAYWSLAVEYRYDYAGEKAHVNK